MTVRVHCDLEVPSGYYPSPRPGRLGSHCRAASGHGHVTIGSVTVTVTGTSHGPSHGVILRSRQACHGDSESRHLTIIDGSVDGGLAIMVTESRFCRLSARELEAELVK
jgi:hypothetical protein